MKNNNKLALAILAVIAIIGVVGGGTYAYWTWVTSDAQKTNVSFTLEDPSLSGDLTATLVGNGTTTATNLKPTECTNTTNAIKKTVTITYKNATNIPAKIVADLNVTAFTIRSSSYRPTAANLKNLKWALTNKGATSCSSSVIASGDFSGVTVTSGTTASNLPLKLTTQEISAAANMTTEGTSEYILWIWLDKAYTHENQGSTNSDPLQGLTFTVAWSGTIGQVSN